MMRGLGMEKFKANLCLDANANGIGEYGDTEALIQSARRGKFRPFWDRALSPSGPVLLPTCKYLVVVYVPEDTRDAETMWCAYAWPRRRGYFGGYRTIFVDSRGNYGWSRELAYSGVRNAPPVGAAYEGKPFVGPVKKRIWEYLWRARSSRRN